MALEMSNPVVSPGHFMLPLPINKDINIDKTVVETKIRDLDHFRRVRVGRSEELAILNLQGLLTLRLYRYKDAVKFFHLVLEKDPKNLNALANLQYVLEKLFRLAEAQHCKDELYRLQQSEGIPASEGTTDPILSINCLEARCLAEHAYAYAFDIHSETIEGKRYVESNTLYKEALERGGNDIDIAEKDDWKFCMAINAHKLFDNMFYANKFDDIQEYVDISITSFHELTQRTPGDPEFKWDSWRNLGDIFRKLQMRKMKPTKTLGPELESFLEDPEKCMVKAMEVSPNNARLLARYANFLYSLNKEIKKPLEFLEQSINLDGSEFNFYAFTTRAMINIKYYHQQIKDGAPLDLLRHVLQLAKSDLETAMSMHVTPWDLARLGQVYHLLAKRHTKQATEIRSLIEKALLYFTKAGDCQDGYKRSEVHLLRGRCLFDVGEKRSAIECFKQVIDCEAPTSKYTWNFNELLHVYLSILRDEIDDLSIVAETGYSLNKALLKYGKSNLKYSIAKFKSAFANEVALLAEYCEEFSEFDHLTSLLREVEPVSPIKADIPARGDLQEAWTKTYQLTNTRGISSVVSAVSAVSAVPEHQAQNTSEEETRAEGGDETSGIDTDAVPVKHSAGNEGDGRLEAITKQLANAGIRELSESSLKSKQNLIRKAPEKGRILGFLYDFCVVYPKSQEDWVSFDLLNELEAIRKLKGCTRDRDALAGTFKISSDIELMRDSASILLIITEDFKEECEELMHHALQLRRRGDLTRVIIPVRRDNSEVPCEISIINSFDACGAVDWNKLALCIEQQIY